MTDKKIILILLLFSVYIFLIKPLNSSFPVKVFELKHIEKAIAKEKFIKKEAKKIEKLYPKEINKIKTNKKLFFPSNISTSSAMSNMQKMIKGIAIKDGLRVVNINWGVAENKKGYIILPISFVVIGYPNNILLFTKNVLSLNKIMKFSIYSTSRYRGKLSLKAVIVGFKINTTQMKKKENE